MSLKCFCISFFHAFMLPLVGWLLDSLCTLTCLVLFPTFSPSSVSPSLLPQGSGHTGKDSWLSLFSSFSLSLSLSLSTSSTLSFWLSVNSLLACLHSPSFTFKQNYVRYFLTTIFYNTHNISKVLNLVYCTCLFL